MNLSKHLKVLFVHFEHIATRVPYSIKLTFIDSMLYKAGFKNYVVDKVMLDFDIQNEDYFFEGVSNGNS
jgi:hypothetical protein